nr:type II toxin-antitoxin system CcdA family antitoxin [Octadecabacter antarcticus]
MNAQPRKSSNLSLDVALLIEAKQLKVNLSRAAEEGVRVAVLACLASQFWAC